MKKRSTLKQEPFDYLMKTIIIGDSGVGKSNLLLRFGSDKFAENYVMTIGINFMYKVVEVDGARIKLQIWDTAGQDKYKTITQSYYNGSHGVIVVYGVDCRSSFGSVRSWIMDLREKVQPDCQIILIANKVDMEQQVVSVEEGQRLAEEFGVPFFQCSAKTGMNVHTAFQSLALMMKDYIIDEKQAKLIKSQTVNLQQKRTPTKSGKCSC